MRELNLKDPKQKDDGPNTKSQIRFLSSVIVKYIIKMNSLCPSLLIEVFSHLSIETVSILVHCSNEQEAKYRQKYPLLYYSEYSIFEMNSPFFVHLNAFLLKHFIKTSHSKFKIGCNTKSAFNRINRQFGIYLLNVVNALDKRHCWQHTKFASFFPTMDIFC